MRVCKLRMWRIGCWGIENCPHKRRVTELKQSKRVKGIICKAILATVILLLLTIGVPISINEVYKYGSLYGGYATEWGAADVLSYYGTILGSAIAVSSLVITIWFTRKQIIRDSYLKSEDEKWSKIETVLADALNDINPMRLLIETMDTGFNNPSATITTIQKYQMSCKVATDQLHTCLSTTDFPKVKNLIDAINTFTEQISEICTEQISAYSKLRNYLSLDTAKKRQWKWNPNIPVPFRLKRSLSVQGL